MATISKPMQTAIGKQINAELYSAYMYLSMAGDFESKNLPGLAAWMRVQWQEEINHALKFFDFVHARGGQVKLQAIDAPPAQWDSPLAAFKAAYEHEKSVTARIHELVNLAAKEKDHASANFLQWYVAEQVEEEASTDRIVRTLTLAGDSTGALLMLDHQLGKRKAGGD